MTDASMTEMERLLEEAGGMEEPTRGDLLQGRILSVQEESLIIDVGLKRDGIVPQSDIQRLPAEEKALEAGDEVSVMVVEPVDPDGNLVVSIAQARESSDWLRARSLMEEESILEGVVTECNRGGVIIPFGRLRGFVPASHLSEIPRGLDESARVQHLEGIIERKIPFKIIEVDPRRRRLVLSERKAIRQWRQEQKALIIGTLSVGEVRTGVVTNLREFGAFVDIGGADGLVHISEVEWNRVEDLSKVLKIGQEVEVMVIRLDPEANRIGLSLKRLQPNPWESAAEKLEIGQVVDGMVTRMATPGIYVRLEYGIEGMLHTNDGPAEVTPGEKIMARITSFDPERERLDLEFVSSEDEQAS
jgi:small subunit ribosomal protein S1